MRSMILWPKMLSLFLWVFAPLLAALSVQAQTASTWVDSVTKISFQRYYFSDVDTGFGYVFPSPSTDEFIGIYTAPVTAGWTGTSLGGGMTGNLLILGWMNGGSAVLSPRMASSYSPPALYAGPKLTVLGSSGVNATHQRIVYRCQNCTSWAGGKIPTSGSWQFGYAIQGSIKPNDPADPGSTILQHTATGIFTISITAAQSSQYQTYLQQLVALPTTSTGPTTTTAPTTTTTIPAPTGPLSCPSAPRPSYSMVPSSGWQVTPILGRLTSPRGIALDSRGNLLVVQRGMGISVHTLDANGCVSSTKTLVSDTGVNHGIDVPGNKLYASSADATYVWDYDANAQTVTNRRTLITGMNHDDHITRTLWVYRKDPNYLIVSSGSNANIDPASFAPATGRAIVKVFDVRTLTASVNYASAGKVLGYGLRNDVGVTEDKAGNIITIENSMDDGYRTVNGNRRDVHTDNPAELIWNLGSPVNPSGAFHGYPYCFQVWQPSSFTDKTFRTGDWFVQAPNNTVGDSWCDTNIQGKPLALLPPHTAPLDIRFGMGSDTAAYASLHGSWDRQPPIGYKVVAVPGSFDSSGVWTANTPNSQSSFVDILKNPNEASCTSGCFRPVALAWSAAGDNLYVSSDTSGEVFLLKKNGVPPGTSVPPTVPPSTPPPSTPPPTTPPPTSPPSTPPPTSPPSTPPPTTTTPPAPPQPTQTLYGQCGGQDWKGPTVCAAGSVCKVSNQWYSQCLPG